MEQNQCSIFNFIDVKAFLKAYRDMRKAADPGFSNLYLCHALGQKNSRGYFNNVVAGRVKIGSTLAERFVKLIGLSGKEEHYFYLLVDYNRAKDATTRERLFREILRRTNAPCRDMNKTALPYYGHWRHAVIRALLDIYDFDGKNYSELAKKLHYKVTVKELKESILLLLELDLISFSTAGFLKLTDKSVTCGKEIERELLLGYQSQNFAQSREVISNPEIKGQKATTMTISVSDDAFDQIKERIDQMRTEIRSIVQQDKQSAQKLYQLNLHLFPQSR